jgi:hypothetical protein
MQTKSRTHRVAWGLAILVVSLAASPGAANARPSEEETIAANSASSAAAAPDKTQANATSGQPDDVALLKQQVALQQKQIERLNSALEDQKRRLEQVLQNSQGPTSQAPNLGQVASSDPVIPKSASKAERASATLAAAPSTAPAANPAATPDPAPVQFHIGTAYITPVGFMDFTSVWRDHAAGTGIGTNFAGIPYGNVYQNNLSEVRFSMQNSRIGFRVDADVKGAHVLGYMEADFLGNNPGNVVVSSNSNTMRSRLYWVDLRRGSWEVLGGQTWSLITPGRTGLSPLPGDIFFSQNMDVNYQLGLFWGRIPEFRVVYHHPSNKVHFAVALDSPEQYVGGSAGGSLITIPSTLNSAYSSELDTGSSGTGVPNVAPDVIAKLVLEPSKKVHFEIGGIERNFKLWNPANSTNYSAVGGGGFLNLNFELFKGFRVLTNNFVSDGGGRYIFGQAPDLIVKGDGSPSLIHADSTVSGIEYTHKSSVIYAYYGGLYVGRNSTIVPVTTTSGTPPVTTTKLTPFGYGYTGAPSGQNRAVQEGTFGIIQTFWKDARYGALSLITQYSYLTRNPWSVATGQPKDAHLNMVFLDLRYTLPGSAPTLGK